MDVLKCCLNLNIITKHKFKTGFDFERVKNNNLR